MARARIAAQPGRGESQHRAQALAARRDEMIGKLRDQRCAALQIVEDDPVDGLEVLSDQGTDPIEGGARLSIGAFQIYNDSHPDTLALLDI